MQGKDPDVPNSQNHQVTVTREQFKELQAMAQLLNQRWAADVHLRNIERISDSVGSDWDFTLVSNGPGTVTRTWDFTPIEKFSSILLKVFKKDGNGVYQPVDDLQGLIDVIVSSINKTTLTVDNYDGNTTENGCAAVKIAPVWVCTVQVEVNYTGAQDGEYKIQAYGERSYDMDTELGDVEIVIGDVKITNTESVPVNVNPLEELVPEDIVACAGDITLQEARTLFDKSLTTAVTLDAGEAFMLTLKKPFRLKYCYPVSTTGTVISQQDFDFYCQDIFGDTYPHVDPLSPGALLPVDARISYIFVVNNTQASIEIAEIIGEFMLGREVYPQGGVMTVQMEGGGEDVRISNTEADPAKVLEEGLMIAEQIYEGYDEGELIEPADIAAMFDKDPDTGYSLAAGHQLYLTLRKPLNVARIKAFVWNTGDGRYEPAEVTITWQPVQFPQYPMLAVDNPALVEDELVAFSINNATQGPIVISEIIVELMKCSEITNSEARPVNVQQLGTMVEEDIVLIQASEEGANVQEIKKILFDKSVRTTYVLPAGENIVLDFKTPFRVTNIKPVDGSGQIISNENLEMTVWFTENSAGTKDFYGGSAIINDEIYRLQIFNLEAVSSINIGELIIETYQDNRVFAHQRQPLNVQPLEELVFENIQSTEGTYELNTLRALFDKDNYSSLSYAPTEGQTIKFNRPMRVEQIKFLTLNNDDILENLALADFDVSYILLDGTSVTVEDYEQPIPVNAEVTAIRWTNNNQSLTATINEIIIELYLQRQNKPVINGRSGGQEGTLGGANPITTTYDCVSSLGRLTHDGYVINDGDSDLTVEVSNDGTNYGFAHTVKEGEVFRLEKFVAWKIRLSVAQGNTAAYRLCVL